MEILSQLDFATLLREAFAYSPKEPLIFTRLYFWGFLLVALLFYGSVHRRPALRNAYLFLMSFFFYYKTAGLFCLTLLVSTYVDYVLSLIMGEWRQKPKRNAALLAFGVSHNLLLLGYFKYAYFFTENYNALMRTNHHVFNYFAHWSNSFFGTTFEVDKIILPIGLSFYTFQKIGYLVDVKRGDVKPILSFLDFSFFIFFFPQLVAGPILRAAQFVPQLYRPLPHEERDFGVAVFWILKGLVKKMFVSDYVSVNFLDRVFANPSAYTGFENLMACYGYSLQVYCDFSGYTDIAIGVSLLFGFHLPPNFNEPHKAQNPSEFWRRWHISLSNWLRDYLYIPLGGNQKGEFRTNLNLMITMLLGGFWHGASWNFVVWGGLNGLGLLFYRYWKRISPIKNDDSLPVVALSVALTFSFISFTRIFFRSPTFDHALAMIGKIAGGVEFALIPSVVSGYALPFSVMLFGFVGQWLPTAWKEQAKEWFVAMPAPVKVAVCSLVAFVVYQAISADFQPFIYFQF
ncbi:MAG: MBOAT family protein [Chloroherpetonaceae bacterium]|nr:MBOAT family protein [Chloroherpetonaceae bacterium]MDW8438583.1 MBOAT family O-acyltransferase [Chloroherpetonaceae bacterium]